jgi:hypothetical protein
LGSQILRKPALLTDLHCLVIVALVTQRISTLMRRRPFQIVVRQNPKDVIYPNEAIVVIIRVVNGITVG